MRTQLLRGRYENLAFRFEKAEKFNMYDIRPTFRELEPWAERFFLCVSFCVCVRVVACTFWPGLWDQQVSCARNEGDCPRSREAP